LENTFPIKLQAPGVPIQAQERPFAFKERCGYLQSPHGPPGPPKNPATPQANTQNPRPQRGLQNREHYVCDQIKGEGEGLVTNLFN